MSQPANICILYSLPDTTAILNSVTQDCKSYRRLEQRLFHCLTFVNELLRLTCSSSLYYFLALNVAPPVTAGGEEEIGS